MCGITGTIDAIAPRAAARVSMLNDAQRHRGPDHAAQVRVGNVTLGNTRLAILDLSPAGNQPFVSADGRFTCVFNGEIYNHRLLVDRYQLPVRTACDGGVIPQLWAKLGVESLAELRGMFAIALVDALEERLYLARDPFGIKPLYWRPLPDGTLVFASELRPLARVGAGLRIDSEAIARYLHLGAMAAGQAPFEEVTSLAPNSVAVFGRDCRAEVRQLVAGGPLRAPRVHPDLETALVEATGLHLGAEVPTALLLSGGVDSAAIAAVSSRLGRELDCVTVAVGGPADEAVAAAQTAQHYGHRFHEVRAMLDEGDVARFFRAMQRPTIDGLNTYLISKAVHEAGFKVALSGLGGDEAVGGYSHFGLLGYLSCLRALDRIPAPVAGAASVLAGLARGAKARRLLARGGPRDGPGLTLLQREVLPAPLATDLTGVTSHWQAELMDMPGLPAGCPPESFSAMTAAEVVIYLQAMLLADADAFSMASSVELRVPFVDCQVFSASLGIAAGGSARPGKAAIAMALADPYLKGLSAQVKRGFSLPMKSWLAGRLAPLSEAASAPDAAVWSVLDREVAERAGLIPLVTRDRWAETWALVALNAWLENWPGSPA